MTLSGCPRKGLGRILIGISLLYPSETSNREVSTLSILSMTLSGYPRKGFGRILFWISLALSFGNPQPRGFNPLYPFHDPFGLFEERNRADSSPHPSETPNREVSTLCILSMTLSGCPRKGFGWIPFLSIPTITLSSRSRGEVRWTLM
jgi:hypothetical protein